MIIKKVFWYLFMTTPLIFATTNQPKVSRLSMMLSEPKRIIWSLKHLDYIQFETPDETGKTELENAIVKATYYKAAIKTPFTVLCQDDGIYTPTLPLHLQAGKDIKATIAQNMGEYNRLNTIKYWANIANKFEGETCNIVTAFCLFKYKPESFVNTIEARFIPYRASLDELVDGDLLTPFIEIEINGIWKRCLDFDKKDYFTFGQTHRKELLQAIN
jgi:inosine/xanthosine triphosphate pyrophosphatase family protein